MTYVSVGLRLVAQIIDGVVVFLGLGYLIAALTGNITGGGFQLEGGAAFVLFALGLAYFVVLEGLTGATLGKLAVGIVVRGTDGRPCGMQASLVRNVLRIVDALPLFYVVGAILVWNSPTRQRLGDRVAGTVVAKRSSVPAAGIAVAGAVAGAAHAASQGQPDQPEADQTSDTQDGVAGQAAPTPTEEKSKSPLKRVGLVVGAVLALVGVIFVGMVVYFMIVGNGEEEGTDDTLVADAEPESAVPVPAEPPVADTTPSEITPPAIAEDAFLTFNEPGYGFTIDYPPHWSYEIVQNMVLFSGPEGTDEFFTTLNFQRVLSTEAGGVHDDVPSLYYQLRDDLAAADGVILHEGPASEVELDDGRRVLTMDMLAEYTLQGERFRQWTLVLDHDRSGGVLLQIAFTAPIELFDAHWPTMEAMLETFELD